MATQTAIELSTLDHHGAGIKSSGHELAEPRGTVLGSSPPDSTHATEDATAKLSSARAWIVITALGGIQFVSSLSNGLLTIGLPTIASALDIHENLLLWPNSVFYLTGGSCLLIAGSIADVIGPRKVNLPGSLLVSALILASGLSKHSIDLIMYRACQGIATAMIVPTAVSIISTNVEDGRPRNIGFASIFLAQPLGFALGLVIGGVFVSTIGWQAGFYIAGGIGLVFTGVCFRALPNDPKLGSIDTVMKRLMTEIDWVGAALASGSLAMLCYVLAMLSATTSNIQKAANIALLTVSLALMPAFAFWVRRQEKLGKPALIPNSLWKNHSFTSVCLMVLLSNAVVNCMELFCSLFFQEVQQLSPIQSAIRVLPQVLTGTLLNFLSGILVDRAPVLPVILGSSILGSVAPLLMATIEPSWSYWYSAFWAQLLAPLSVDILFTVGTLVVSSAFPSKTQALAGAVFQTFAQLGTSVGLCIMSVISASVTAQSGIEDKSSPEAEMKGYRATFWALFAWMAITCVIAPVGLRKVGKVGVKRD